MAKINRELKKIIKEGQKNLSKRVMYDNEDRLLLKLSSREIKNALDVKSDDENIYYSFKSDWYNFLSEFRKYYVSEEEALSIQLDPKTDPKYREAFKKTWKDYHKIRIIQQNKINKGYFRKVWQSLIYGLLVLGIVVLFNILSMYNENNQALKICVICSEAIMILAWVFLWESYYCLFYDLRSGREKLFNLYKMYDCKFYEEEIDSTIVKKYDFDKKIPNIKSKLMI